MLRDVTSGATHGDRTLIRDGLKPGDKVVTQGVDRLRDGAKVEVIAREGTAPPPLAEGGNEEGRSGARKRGAGSSRIP
jgi:multidrug efflux system membrane fusion protein